MPFRVFQDENIAQGVPTGLNYLAGVSDIDDSSFPENILKIPVLTQNLQAGYSYYNCWIEIVLDAGMVLHKALPQKAQPVDTIASTFLEDGNAVTSTSGVNSVSKGTFQDIIQRMATSEYRFRLRGEALRYVNKVPIPGIKKLAGVPFTPIGPQIGFNKVVGNYSGVLLYLAQWDIEYMVTAPPTKNVIPPDNLALHIAGDAQAPTAIAPPVGPIDSNATPSAPPSKLVTINTTGPKLQ